MHNHCGTLTLKSQDWHARKDLCAFDRCLAAYLDSLPKRFVECWKSAETMASELGVSVRTIQNALRRLSLKGLVELITDYGLRTRRAVLLLWRCTEPTPVEEETTAHAAAHTPPVHTPTPRLNPAPVAPPPSPPREPREETAPAARAEGSRRASHDEINRVVAKAARLWPHGEVRRPLLALARRYSLSWVEQALDETTPGKPWRWLTAKLEAWSRDGGPPPRPETEREYWEKVAAFLKERFGRKHEPQAAATGSP